MGYEIDLNRAGSTRLRQEIGLATTARAQGREGASPHYRFYELEPAIVVKINLTDKDASKIGEATVRPLYSYATVPDAQLPIAVPLDSNVKNYPLKNEVVIVVEYGGRLYYTQRMNYFNRVNQNITKDPFTYIAQDTQNKQDYDQSSAGNPNSDTRTADETAVKGGLYFEPNKKVQSLLPLEGDIIYEGRFGNSIRIGGTPSKGKTGVDKRFNNTWAFGESDGQPIIILRSGQKEGGDQKVPYVEDINKDPSSMYLTSGQTIPLKVANTNQKAWKSNAPSVYDGNQVIIASDRIIFNAKKGEIMMFATAPIGLSTAKSFFVDAGVDTIINSPKIYLGLDAKEHVVLGDKTKEWLDELVGDLLSMIDAINKITVLTGTGPSTNVQASASPGYTDLVKLQQKLNQLKTKTPSLLSKQNFTL
jgi:hypothetical protein